MRSLAPAYACLPSPVLVVTLCVVVDQLRSRSDVRRAEQGQAHNNVTSRRSGHSMSVAHVNVLRGLWGTPVWALGAPLVSGVPHPIKSCLHTDRSLAVTVGGMVHNCRPTFENWRFA